MSEQPKYGKAVPGPIHHLGEIHYKMPLDPNVKYGKATPGPIHPLPEFGYNMLADMAKPALQIVLQLRPEAAPAVVGLDIARLSARLNRLAIGYGGGGLVIDEAASAALAAEGKIKLTFSFTAAEGAPDWVALVVEAINRLPDGEPPTSIERYEATQVRAA